MPLFLLYFVNSYWLYFALSVLFGLVGASLAVLTALLAPSLLNYLSKSDPKNRWRILPVIYSVAMAIMGLLFLFFVKDKEPEGQAKAISTCI